MFKLSLKPQKLLVEISKLWTEQTKIGHKNWAHFWKYYSTLKIQIFQKIIIKVGLLVQMILFYLTCLLLALYTSSSNSYIFHYISFHFSYTSAVTLFSINNVCINSFMPNWNKKYLTISNTYILLCWNNYYTICHQIWWPLYQS